MLEMDHIEEEEALTHPAPCEDASPSVFGSVEN